MYNMEIQTEAAEKRESSVGNINNNYMDYTSQVPHDCDGKYAQIQPTLPTDVNGTQPRARPAQKKSKKLKRYRRPMNDFLMFCKKHRRRVRQVYSTKENRFITKKLGLLWSLLTDEQKHPYKVLSDNHKERYLTAFPDYQWTKNPKVVPESTSTAAAVPTGEDGSNTSSTDGGNSPEETLCNDERVAAQALLAISTGVGLPPMATFRLADVNQMGSLSTLIAGSGDHSVGATMRSEVPANGLEHNYSVSNDTAATVEEEPYRNMQHFLENMRPKPNQAAMSTFSVPPAMSVGAVEAQANSTPSAVSGRANRSCKGKRYKEFMEQQQLARHSHGTGASSNQRKQAQKRSVAPTATVTSASATVPDLSATHVPPTSSVRIEGGATSSRVPDDEAFAALNKELNAEIDQLPLFDIMEILLKQNKRHKKPYAISSKAGKKRKVTSPKSCIAMPPPETITSASISSPSPPPPPPVVHPVIASSSPVEVPAPPVTPISSAPALPPTAPTKIVGCRKRKAPKECITRYTVL
ncbi:protein capicua homolog [Anopheles ziemanni]|uniref:protein capicua homolog n=1 Tax=Anopheles coustani TaxID=139045 RepID=UPI0026594BA6|nr:protein capicua homolog [Anopheles coustani]XP_058169338.1 protein capicua homolog [Anopheles ziemanni]